MESANMMCNSLIPRPFEGKRKGLVHTGVCMCKVYGEYYSSLIRRDTIATMWSGRYGQRILSIQSLY